MEEKEQEEEEEGGRGLFIKLGPEGCHYHLPFSTRETPCGVAPQWLSETACAASPFLSSS